MSLTILDLTDREILFVVNGTLNNDGWTTSAEIADALGVTHNGKRTPAGQVSPRLSYMARQELLAKLDPQQVGLSSNERVWMITEFGVDIMNGRIPVGVQRAVEGASAGAAVTIMRELMRSSYVRADTFVATAVRREYQHNAAQRR